MLGIGAAAIAGAVLGIALYMLLQAPVLAPAEDGTAGSARVQTQAQTSSESRVESPAATVSGILPFPKPSPPAREVNVESENARRRPTSPASYALSTAQIEALQVEKQEVAAAPVQAPVNIVLLGVDKLNDFNGNTDVIVVVSLRPEHQNGLVLSIPRDLCIDACDSWSSRINYVFASEGPAALLKNLSDLTGLYIDRYAAVNFDGFERIIDALGGAVITADRSFAERFYFPDGSTDVLILDEGENHISVSQALMFARSRKFDPAGDFARICRQQQVLDSLKSRAISPRTILAAPSILRDVRDSMVTNFTVGELISLLRTAISIPSENIRAGYIRSDAGYIRSDGNLASPTRGDDGAYLLRANPEAIGVYVGNLIDGLDIAAALPRSVSHGQCSTGVIEASLP